MSLPLALALRDAEFALAARGWPAGGRVVHLRGKRFAAQQRQIAA